MSETEFWYHALDASVKKGTLWFPAGIDNGYSLQYKTTHEGVLDEVGSFLSRLPTSAADQLTISHAPDNVIILYFVRSGEVVSLRFSAGSDDGIILSGLYRSEKFGLVAEFENGSFTDGFSLVSSVI